MVPFNFQRWLATIVAIALASVGMAAQGQEESVKAEILTLSLSGTISDLHFGTADGVTTTSVYSRGFGVPIEYTGSPELVFFRPSSNPDGFSGASREVIAKARLPNGASRVLLVFESMEGETDRYRVAVFENGHSRFPAGGYRFLNLSKVPFVGVAGTERFTLNPRASAIVAPKGNDQGNVEVKVYSAEKGNEGLIYSSVWQIKDTRRTTVFLLPSESAKQGVQVQKFVEPIVPKKEE